MPWTPGHYSVNWNSCSQIRKHGKKGEMSKALDIMLLICLLLGGNEREKKLVYIKDTKSLVACNMLCSRLEV